MSGAFALDLPGGWMRLVIGLGGAVQAVIGWVLLRVAARLWRGGRPPKPLGALP